MTVTRIDADEAGAVEEREALRGAAVASARAQPGCGQPHMSASGQVVTNCRRGDTLY